MPVTQKPTEITKAPNLVTSSFGIKSPVAPVVPKKEEPKVDMTGIVVGADVCHNKFGDGKIVGIRENMVTVRFDSGGEKTFSIPIAVGKGLLKIK